LQRLTVNLEHQIAKCIYDIQVKSDQWVKASDYDHEQGRENNELPRRKQRGINNLGPLLIHAASGGELNPITRLKLLE